jgi:competence protein ComEA
MGTVIVHVTGQVRKPGLQQLPAGSRVADAIQAAGGVTKTQAQDSVNLARVLIDGEQIVVGAGLSQINSSGGGQGTGKVSLNSENQLQLESLPGVGPSLAQRIMEYRSSHGGFRSVEELDDVAGIGSATLNRLRPLVSM